MTLFSCPKYLLLLFICSTQQLAFADSPKSESQPEWVYSVRPGDNLIHFARQHLINPDDWKTLQRLNKVNNPYRMQIAKKLRVPIHLIKQLPAPVEVVLATGQAGILNANNAILPVVAGQKLGAGTNLKTGENSKLSIKFADGSIVSMQPNSILKLDTLSVYSGGGMVDATLRLQQGKLETEANPEHRIGNQMQIITPTAVAAVRGTKFRVSTSDAVVTQETLEGAVALQAAGSEVAVNKGFGSLSEGGGAPLPPVELLQAPVLIDLPIKFEVLPVNFNLPAQDGAAAWLGKLSDDPKFNTLVGEKLSQNSILSFNDIPDGKYFLKVRARDKKGLEGYDAVHEFNLNARPLAPEVLAPVSGATVRDANPQLNWTKRDPETEYLLQVAQDANFKELLLNQKVANNAYKIDKSLTPGQYYWRLASVNGDDQGPFMPASTFSYKTKPNAPDISQLGVQIQQNKVFVTTVNPPAGLNYQAIIHNEFNNQKNVWQSVSTNGEFNYLLKEYGPQTLVLRLVDVDGVSGPEATYEFNAPAP